MQFEARRLAELEQQTGIPVQPYSNWNRPRNAIRNCNVTLDVSCPLDWNILETTADEECGFVLFVRNECTSVVTRTRLSRTRVQDTVLHYLEKMAQARVTVRSWGCRHRSHLIKKRWFARTELIKQRPTKFKRQRSALCRKVS